MIEIESGLGAQYLLGSGIRDHLITTGVKHGGINTLAAKKNVAFFWRR